MVTQEGARVIPAHVSGSTKRDADPVPEIDASEANKQRYLPGKEPQESAEVLREIGTGREQRRAILRDHQ